MRMPQLYYLRSCSPLVISFRELNKLAYIAVRIIEVHIGYRQNCIGVLLVRLASVCGDQRAFEMLPFD